ncbi:hypothetical protein Poly51_53580 [Rubripirellula tenax]|uniref:Chain length determinant protein n=2 Tax=Rubripirellula tenax TaxID=2528015 RepID=A0A5C6EFK3_9BACT|nr:hypothetical protein Poly51_53580 [Rubripirellula tenax]
MRGMLRRPIYLVFSLLVAILTGGAMAHFFRSERHHYFGKMMYVPNRVTEPLYTSPNLRDLTAAMVNPVMLEELRSRWNLRDELQDLRNRLAFQMAGEASLDTSFWSSDPQQAEAVLQHAMEYFVDQSRSFRSDAIANHIDDFERETEASKSAQRAAGIRLEKKLREVRLQTPTELVAEIFDLRRSIAQSTEQVVATQDRLQLSRAQFESLLAMRESKASSDLGIGNIDSETESIADPPTSSQVQNPDESPAQGVSLAVFENENEAASVTHDLRKQKLLEDRIRREKERARANVEVELLKKEFDRSSLLHQKGLISDALLEKAKGDLEVLLVQQSQQVKEMEGQLDEIHERIELQTNAPMLIELNGSAASTGSKPVASPGEPNEKQTIAMLRGSEVAADIHLEYLTEELEGKTARLRILTAIQKQIEPLVKDVDNGATKLDRLNARNETFIQTLRSATNELIIVQNASPMIDGVTTNARTLFAAGFIASLGCLLVPLFLADLRTASKHKPTTQKVFGFPVLGRTPDARRLENDPTTAEDELRRLAIRIRHKFDHPKGVMTVASGLGVNELDVDGLVAKLALQLESENKKVLVVDMADIDRHAIASQDAMVGRNATFAELRSQSDFVLIRAPMFASALRRDIAASLSDAIVLVVPKDEANSPRMQQAIVELTVLETSIVGVILA